LKCETIEAKEPVKDGFVLVCVDGYPLGWGKAAKGVIKNKYLAGWRMM
jgi:NOL1/NOP2/fmu family ribosome biogenesis protein